ncbi:hypothetical protein ZWY2020_008371 [Hordeum vulgare]|nr:hypothetical protein ZWY2020_008371 [Hordeum vulgare]
MQYAIASITDSVLAHALAAVEAAAEPPDRRAGVRGAGGPAPPVTDGVEMFRMIGGGGVHPDIDARRPKMGQVVRILDSLTLNDVDLSNGGRRIYSQPRELPTILFLFIC